jgi:formylglycine-generating enzyme required for sulfatase activity
MARRTKSTRTEPTATEAVEAIRDWTVRHGRLPTEQEWADAGDGHPSAPAVARKFGSWKGALAAAGHPLEPGHRPLTSAAPR